MDGSTDDDSSVGPPHRGAKTKAVAGSDWSNGRRVNKKTASRRTSPSKSKAVASPAASREGGAADARALAWEKAALKAKSVKDNGAAVAGTKRSRTESRPVGCVVCAFFSSACYRQHKLAVVDRV